VPDGFPAMICAAPCDVWHLVMCAFLVILKTVIMRGILS
jgi:hypothetical protein